MYQPGSGMPPATGAESLAAVGEPYFGRAYDHFCVAPLHTRGQAVSPSRPASPQHHPEPPIFIGQLQSSPALLALVDVQLVVEQTIRKHWSRRLRNSKGITQSSAFTSISQLPGAGSGTWEVRQADHRDLAGEAHRVGFIAA